MKHAVDLAVAAFCWLPLSAACAGKSVGSSATGDAAGSPADAMNTGGNGSAPASGGAVSPFPDSACPVNGQDECVELSTGIHDGIYSIAVDPAGDLLLAGVAILDGAGSNPVAFIAKYTPDLEPVWFERLDAGLTDIGQLTTDQDGNIFAVASARGTVTDLYASNDSRAVILKLSTSGEILWTKSSTYTLPTKVALALGGDGNVVLGGYDADSLFLAKYSAEGDPLWDKAWSAGQNVAVDYVASDAAGNIFLTPSPPNDARGRWVAAELEKHTAIGELDWNVSLGGTLVCGLAADSDGDVLVLLNSPPVLMRYSATGEQLWQQDLPDFSPPYGLSMDANGNAYAVGMANDFKAPGYLGVVAKYSPDGDRLWSEELAVPIGIMALSVAASIDGSAFVVGPNGPGTATFITHALP